VKKVCVLIILCLCTSLYAFDRSLIGSWGLIYDYVKEEFIRFGQNEITLFGERVFERGVNTIIIDDFDGDDVIVQYHLLSQNFLLFIMWNLDNPSESLTLILSRL